MLIVIDACVINIINGISLSVKNDSESVNDGSKSIIDDSRVMFQIAGYLNYGHYDHNDCKYVYSTGQWSQCCNTDKEEK
jgi:hypothetical protein